MSVQVDTVMSVIDLFVSLTGNSNIITLDHMKNLKNNAFVGNTGHFDNEIDFAFSGLGRHESRHRRTSKIIPSSLLLTGDRAGFRSTAATGHQSLLMLCSFVNQVLMQPVVLTLATACKKGVYLFPKLLDE